MPGRAIWKGIITFGPISVPVKLYSVLESARVNFHLLHDQDRQRLRQQMVCPLEERPVEREETVKGYEVEKGLYVIVEPSELEEAQPPSGRAVEVRQFVAADSIDPRYYDRPYYLGPDENERAFAALAECLSKEGVAGICNWVMRKKSYLGALRLVDRTLCLISMHYHSEITPVQELELPQAKLDKRELEVANYLIETLAADWNPDAYHNEYDDQVRELIERKSRGEPVPIKRRRRPRSTRPDRLLETLEASVRAAGKKRKSKKESHAKTGK